MMRFITLLLTLILSQVVIAADKPVQVTLDRSWGLLIGDTLTATIHLPVSASELDPDALPQTNNRHGAWLYLKNSQTQDQELVLLFQVINVPKENRQVGTPELQLRTLSGEFINVPSVQLQIGSFLARSEGQADFTPRPDSRLAQQDTSAPQQNVMKALVVLLLSSLVWIVWHFGFRPRQRLPFAAALFALTKMRWLGRKDTDKASRSLHHAFNATAGGVVVPSQLNKLLQKAPWLIPLESEIADFYQQSAKHFFSPGGMQQKEFNDIVALTKACRARERVAWPF